MQMKKQESYECVDKKVETVLLLQEYPPELNGYLGIILRDFQRTGFLVTIAKAYCLGVINGKRMERRKRHKN